jgi:hypothetical protein
MNQDKIDIERSVVHQHKILRALRDRLQQREIQEAQQGINVDPVVMNEIRDLTERIQRHEEELARLQTEAAVDKEPMAEVEYRMLVAEAWDTPEVRPSVAAAARLEYHRLRLGVLHARAQQIEREIRNALVRQYFPRISMCFYDPCSHEMIIHWTPISGLLREDFNIALQSKGVNDLNVAVTIRYPFRGHNYDQESIDIIVKCIRLDIQLTLKLFGEKFSRQPLKIINLYFEPSLPDDLTADLVPPEEIINTPNLLSELFRSFRQSLWSSPCSMYGEEVYSSIRKFVDELHDVVVKIE